MDCKCVDYEAGIEDQRNGRSVSPYKLFELHHGSCYRAGQIDERRRQVAQERGGYYFDSLQRRVIERPA